jgi:hypothetical protein
MTNVEEPQIAPEQAPVQAPEQTPEDEELSVVEKIVGVFIAPVATFKYLARRPDFWSVFIVLSLLSIAAAVIVLPKTLPAQISLAVEKVQNTPGMPEEGRKAAIEMIPKITPIATYVGAVLATPIGLAVLFLLSAAILFFISLMQGLDTDFKRLLGVIPWASLIGLPSSIINAVILMMRDAMDKTQIMDLRYLRPFSLLSLIPQSVDLPRPVEMILTMIDPFYVWGIIVLVIAVQQANKSKQSQAVLSVTILTVLTLIAFGAMSLLNNAPAVGGQ